MLEVFYILGALFVLWVAGDVAIDAAKRLAKYLRISETVIGLTVVSIGTSLPEIATNIQAGLQIAAGNDVSGIAVGNIIGSNLSQITLVLGIVGFIATLYIHHKSLKRDGLMMLFATLLLYFFAFDLVISQIEGVILILIYFGYLIHLLKEEKIFIGRRQTESKIKILKDIFLVLAGIAAIVISAGIIIDNGVLIARSFGIREVLIGIFVGLGTTLPELMVSVKALLKHSKEISIGNLIGSNITDPLLSMGIGAAIAGYTLTTSTLIFDFGYLIVSTVIALLLLFNHTNLNRIESSILIILYIFFMYLQFFVVGI